MTSKHTSERFPLLVLIVSISNIKSKGQKNKYISVSTNSFLNISCHRSRRLIFIYEVLQMKQDEKVWG